GRGHFSSLPATVSPDYHDYHGGAIGRPAAGTRHGYGRRVTPAPGYHHRRWVACQPDAHVVYDTGRLPIPRPPAALVYVAPPEAPTAALCPLLTLLEPSQPWQPRCRTSDRCCGFKTATPLGDGAEEPKIVQRTERLSCR